MPNRTLTIQFREGATLRIFDAPVGLDGDILLRPDIVSFDVRVFDLDAQRPNKPTDAVYEDLGIDPSLTNASGVDYVSTAERNAASGEGWASRGTYSVVYDLDSSSWERIQGGHTYALEITYSTLNDGQVFLEAMLEASPLISENKS